MIAKNIFMNKNSLYEQPELREITGATLRPGGLELTMRALELCAFKTGDKIMNLGCGPGESLALLRSLGLNAWGLDQSAILLQEAIKHGPAVLARAQELPVQNAALDGVRAECVLSLMPDKLAVLREIRRALKNGGRLLLSDLFLKSSAAFSECCNQAARETSDTTAPSLQKNLV